MINLEIVKAVNGMSRDWLVTFQNRLNNYNNDKQITEVLNYIEWALSN